MTSQAKVNTILFSLSGVFLALAGALLLRAWGNTPPLPPVPLVDPSFTSNAPSRVSYSQMVAEKADLSDFDCYGCHERSKPPPLRFDDQHNIIVPKEHSDIVMKHGTHNRNNLCFNCHEETNLVVFATRDGRQLKLSESTPLCGSCHGPTYRDWEAGAHGRTSGSWTRQPGTITRLDCVSCHNPHSPKFQPRTPAPGPHPLRVKTDSSAEHAKHTASVGRSAGFQPAVSPISSRLGAVLTDERLDYSTVCRLEALRYSRLETCATANSQS
jgi:hypothetical protein